MKRQMEVPEVHLIIKKQNKTVLSRVSLIVLWRMLCTFSLNTSLSLQTMCNSENPIINQCFDRTELTDKKRPETVRTPELGLFLLFKIHIPSNMVILTQVSYV